MGRFLKNKFFLLFLGSFIVQLAIMPFAYHGDMLNHIAWGKYIIEHGPSSIYFYNFQVHLLSDANYPPLMLWLCSMIVLFTQLLQNVFWQLNTHIPLFPSKLVFFSESIMPFILTFKLFIILSNLGIAWVAYLLLKNISTSTKKYALITAPLILFNPAIIFGSTSWGQIDIFPIFFVLLGIYILICKKNVFLSALLMTVALLFKQTVVIFIPVYLLAVLKFFNWKATLKSILVLAVGTWLAYAPFVNEWKNLFSPIMVYLNQVQFADSNNLVSKSAWNFWVLLFGLSEVPDSQKFIGISYQFIGYMMTFISLMLIIIFYWKAELETTSAKLMSTIYALLLISFASFLFITRLHSRHLLPTLIPLTLLNNNRKWILIQIAYLTIFNLINMMFYWHPWVRIVKANTLEEILIRLGIVLTLILFFYFFWQFSLVLRMHSRRK